MPKERKATTEDLEQFQRFSMLRAPLKEILKEVAAGGKLTVIESEFNDPGDDYSALELTRKVGKGFGKRERIGFWPGY